MRSIECACCAKNAATLAARDAEIEELRKLAYIGDHYFPHLTWKSRIDECLAEIERLKAELSLAQFDAATDRAAAVSLGELVEKLERQLVWAARVGVRSTNETDVEYDFGENERGVETRRVLYHDGTDAGLLAAIDEATKENE